MGRFLRLTSTGTPRQYDEASSLPIYDEYVTIGSGGLATGSPLTLPSSKTYTSNELEVFFRGQALETVLDYNYYGSGARTAITFTFDLVQGDIIRFRIG
jgi:hypothetical protein